MLSGFSALANKDLGTTCKSSATGPDRHTACMCNLLLILYYLHTTGAVLMTPGPQLSKVDTVVRLDATDPGPGFRSGSPSPDDAVAMQAAAAGDGVR